MQQYLLSMAADLAGRIDSEIDERRFDAETVSSDSIIEWYLEEDPYRDFEAHVKTTFNNIVENATEIFKLVTWVTSTIHVINTMM